MMTDDWKKEGEKERETLARKKEGRKVMSCVSFVWFLMPAQGLSFFSFPLSSLVRVLSLTVSRIERYCKEESSTV